MWGMLSFAAPGLLLASIAGSSAVFAETVGIASYYGARHHGHLTASGEIFDRNKLTATHRSLAFGTTIEVVNLDNGRHVLVRVNDRGPFARGRVLDLSERAARDLGFIGAGTARVRISTR